MFMQVPAHQRDLHRTVVLVRALNDVLASNVKLKLSHSVLCSKEQLTHVHALERYCAHASNH